MTDPELTRRRLLAAGLLVPPAALALGACGADDDGDGDDGGGDDGRDVLAATPACDDDPTEAQTEGPFWTPRSPRRRSLVARGMRGVRLTLTGRVLTTRCKPIKGALLDFWQADAAGLYDNDGFRLRGHQLTDSEGRYRLVTVVPGLYSGRTRHIHVKAKAPRTPVLTTQLYFPGVRQNEQDGIYDPDLLVQRYHRVEGGRAARFDFVLRV